jgi:hypothetical protein
MAGQRERITVPRKRLARGQAGRMLSAAGLVSAAWLLVAPQLERAARIEQILTRGGGAASAMYALCRTEGGVRALTEALASAPAQVVDAALADAEAQGCLVALPVELVARRALKRADVGASAVIAHAGAAEVALDGLEAQEEAERLVALRALVGMEPGLTLDERRRALARLRERPVWGARGQLMTELLEEAPRALEEAPRAPDLKLEMPQLGDSLKVGRGGVLYQAPAEGER